MRSFYSEAYLCLCLSLSHLTHRYVFYFCNLISINSQERLIGRNLWKEKRKNIRDKSYWRVTWDIGICCQSGCESWFTCWCISDLVFIGTVPLLYVIYIFAIRKKWIFLKMCLCYFNSPFNPLRFRRWATFGD